MGGAVMTAEDVPKARCREDVFGARSSRWRMGTIALALWAGCGPEPELTGEPLRAQAQALWQARCATCHGVTGRGDGPTGRSLDPRPRDFQDAAWQARVDDARLRRVIVEGGAALGLSAEMAANADLADRPAMVGALVEIVRGLAVPGPAQARDRGIRETK